MTMAEYVTEVSFMLGMPANENVEGMSIQQGIMIAFRELKRYIKTPAEKTVPFQTRIDLSKVGINTKQVLNVQAARPRIGLTMGSIESGNVFQVAASVNVHGMVGQNANINIDPIMREMAMAQVRNTLSTDFQWHHDISNNVVYVTHRDPKPSQVTVRYVPLYTDVSEIIGDTWIDYLVRMSVANMKISLGRSRSKYRIEGSNVTNDGEILLQEAHAELEQIRSELADKKQKMVILN